MKRIVLLACTSAFVFGLAACGGKDASEPASAAVVAVQTSNPAKAVESFAAQLHQSDLLQAAQIAVPPEKLDALRVQWKDKMAKEEPSDEERAEFAEQMSKFTAPDAEAVLYAELEPLLIKYETELAAQMPMMIGMGQGFAMQSIQASEDLTDVQKQQAIDSLGAVAGWLQTAKFADRDLAKKGIAIAVKSARDLELKTIDDLRALDFDHAMGKGSIAFSGMKDILALYDFDLNKTFSSVKADVVTQGDGAAKVAVNYSLLGKALTTETDMIEVDGRWYDKDTIEQLISGMASADDNDEDDIIVVDEEVVVDEDELATEE